MKNKIIILIVVSIILFISVIYFGFILEKTMSGKEIGELAKSVLILEVYDKDNNILSTGSGFVVFDNKTLVTNYHVIEDGYKIEATSEDDVHYLLNTVKYYDKEKDIAILEFDHPVYDIPILKVSDEKSLIVGNTVYAIGSPLGLKNTVSNGIISSIREADKYIQFTAPISHGSSGGALLDEYGKVLGITSASYSDGQNLNLAIPYKEFINIDMNEKMSIVELYNENNFLGNTKKNYSNDFCIDILLVENDEFLFEAYNQENQIIKHNKKTGELEKLDIYGTNLSLYKEELFYFSSDRKLLCKYNISSKENKQIYELDIAEKFILSANGIVVFDKDESVLLDYSGNIKFKLPETLAFINSVVYDKNTFIYLDSNKNEIVAYDYISDSYVSLYQGYNTIDTILYLDEEHIIIKEGIVFKKYNIFSGQTENYIITHDKQTSIFFGIYNNKLYFSEQRSMYYYDFEKNEKKLLKENSEYDVLVCDNNGTIWAYLYDYSLLEDFEKMTFIDIYKSRSNIRDFIKSNDNLFSYEIIK